MCDSQSLNFVHAFVIIENYGLLFVNECVHPFMCACECKCVCVCLYVFICLCVHVCVYMGV